MSGCPRMQNAVANAAADAVYDVHVGGGIPAPGRTRRTRRTRRTHRCTDFPGELATWQQGKPASCPSQDFPAGLL